MSKNKTRLIVVIAAIVTIISTFCYAETENNNANVVISSDTSSNATSGEEPVNPNARTATGDENNSATLINETDGEPVATNNEIETTSDNNNQINEDVYNGDLYVFQSDVVMDKLVDGNVFIIGNNVTITGQCSGNMFILGNNVTFDKSFIQASVFVFGSNVKYDAVSTSLYCFSKDLSIDNQFGVYGDIYASCANFNFDGLIGRNAFINADNINLKENATFYGDLNYSSDSKMEIPEGVVQGNTNYKKLNHFDDSSVSPILYYAINLAQILVLVVVAYIITKLFTKDPEAKEDSVMSKPLKTFGIGLLTLIVLPIIFVLLLFTVIGISTAGVLMVFYSITLLLAQIIFSITLARYFLSSVTDKKGLKEFFATIFITVCVWILAQIPYVGGIFYVIFAIFGFGIVIYTPLFKKSKVKEIKSNDKN